MEQRFGELAQASEIQIRTVMQKGLCSVDALREAEEARKDNETQIMAAANASLAAQNQINDKVVAQTVKLAHEHKEQIAFMEARMSDVLAEKSNDCLLYTSPSPRDS